MISLTFIKSNKGFSCGQYPTIGLNWSNSFFPSYPNKVTFPFSYNTSFVIALNVVVFPEPLKPNKPNFSLGSRPKYKLLTTLTFFLQQLKNVLYNPSIFVDKFGLVFIFLISAATN